MTEVTIHRLGREGDGLSAPPAKGAAPLAVPNALPGEKLEVALGEDGSVESARILAPSPERVSAPCPHFRRCGGCTAQHMSETLYREWKRSLVVDALARQNIETDIAPLVAIAPGTRRRASFAVRRTKSGTELGFHARRSDVLVPIAQCPVLVPALEERLASLGEVVRPGLSRKGQAAFAVTATSTGLDLAVSGDLKPLTLEMRQSLAALADDHDLARLSWAGETVAERVTPRIAFGRLDVALPLGSFAQASAEAEDALAGMASLHLSGARRIVDLFAGCGPFAARLAEAHAVHAVDSDGAAITALAEAIRREGPRLGLKPLTVETRDLYRRPLLPAELATYDGAVLDPPRAGALEQTDALAASSIPRIAYISCNPTSFARDAQLLVEGGYRLTRVTPVDQFLWSPHIELVGEFTRG